MTLVVVTVFASSTVRRLFPVSGAGTGIVLLLAALLLTLQFRTERAIREALGIPSPQLEAFGYRLRRAETQRRAMEEEVAALREQVAEMRRIAAGAEGELRRLSGELDYLRALAGLTALAGPGLVIVLRDSDRVPLPGEDPNNVLIHYTDLQAIVNDLWAAGAEAIAINGERLFVGSSIQCVGATILVNHRRLAPPFRVEAIGNPEALRTYLLRPAGTVQDLRALDFPATIAAVRHLVVPPYRGPLPITSRGTLR
ncbi:MAG: DUF881 domain-containing protein [Armatimonadota bacterium]|nr:DUF881 domain-containing protein [Armatimonadota bacterium]MDR7451307.1 DUF881 domain-containing protein [Armatimonadota bacterium]MDR7466790.1 DUF881 domain-containing protein [Armatimonadota bacterium]MDR7492737.1 DUF881 domain-containing protein [Armatimonadota bacterium]MDR7498513.1 DUF881 domain-containing protein [Armatimonadota bacterium]